MESESTGQDTYKLNHLVVVIDSRQENAHVDIKQPRRTAPRNQNEILSSLTKSNKSHTTALGLNLGLHPQGTISGSGMKTEEETLNYERSLCKL